MLQKPLVALGCVVGRFPNREEVIRDLFDSDPAFQSLCEDYCECLRSLAHWTGQASEQAPLYQQDYQELLSDLESEIQRYLDRKRKIPP